MNTSAANTLGQWCFIFILLYFVPWQVWLVLAVVYTVILLWVKSLPRPEPVDYQAQARAILADKGLRGDWT
jgi:hypothetical protein